VESRRRDKVARAFAEGLERDMNSLRPFMPERAESVLDIGCGLGGIDLLLHRYYAPESPSLALLDRDSLSPEVFYGYEDVAASYSSLAHAREFLEENGVPEGDIETFDAAGDGYPAGGRFDLILSLISWGFHYPLSTYLNEVDASLAPGGTLIVDVRDGTGAEEELRALGDPELVEESRSRRRLCIRR
jgi:SAM-dependent methyltransferase